MPDFSDQTTLLLRQASGSLALPAPAPLSERITAELTAIVTSVTGEMVALPRATTQTLPAFARDISWTDVRWTDLPGDLRRISQSVVESQEGRLARHDCQQISPYSPFSLEWAI